MEGGRMELDPSLWAMIDETIGNDAAMDEIDATKEDGWGESHDAEMRDAVPEVEALFAALPDVEDDDESHDARLRQLMVATPFFPQMLGGKSTSAAEFREEFRRLSRGGHVALRRRIAQGHAIQGPWLKWYQALEEQAEWLELRHLGPEEEAELVRLGEAWLHKAGLEDGRGELWPLLLDWSAALSSLNDVLLMNGGENAKNVAAECIVKYQALLACWWKLVGIPLNNPTDAVWLPEQQRPLPAPILEMYRKGTGFFTQGLADLRILLSRLPATLGMEQVWDDVGRLERELLPMLCRVKGVSCFLEKRTPSNAKTEMKERKTMRNPFRCSVDMEHLASLGYNLNGASVEVLTVTEAQAIRLQALEDPDMVIPDRNLGSVVVKLSQAEMEVKAGEDGHWKASLCRPHHSIAFHDEIRHAERRPGIAHVAQNISRLVFLVRLHREGQTEPTTFAKVAPGPLFITSHAKEWMMKSLPLLLYCLVQPSSLCPGAPFPAAVAYKDFKDVSQFFLQSILLRASGRSVGEIPHLHFGAGFREHLNKCLGMSAAGVSEERPIYLPHLLDDSRQPLWRELYLGAEALAKASVLRAWLQGGRADLEEVAFQPNQRKQATC